MDERRYSKKAPLLFRMWFYMRTGFATYLSFALGFINTAILAYYLLVERVSFLKDVFPSFTEFIVVIGFLLVTASAALGWIHFQKMPAYGAEMDISVESNPYYYKPTPGIMKDLWMPAFAYLIRLTEVSLEESGKLTNEDRIRLRQLHDQFERLYNNGAL